MPVTRNGDRIQASTISGKFAKEGIIAPERLGAWLGAMISTSTPDHKYFYVADGTNHKVWILQSRLLESSINRTGRSNSGEFQTYNTLAGTSKGNLIRLRLTNKRLHSSCQKRPAVLSMTVTWLLTDQSAKARRHWTWLDKDAIQTTN